MATRSFIYEDDAASTPPSPSGLPEGFAMFTNDGHLHVIRTGAFVDLTPPPPVNVDVVVITASRTLTLADCGKVLECHNTADITLVLPADGSGEPSDISGWVVQVDRLSTFNVTVAADVGGVLLNDVSGANHQITNQYGSVVVRRLAVGTSAYLIVGAYT